MNARMFRAKTAVSQTAYDGMRMCAGVRLDHRGQEQDEELFELTHRSAVENCHGPIFVDGPG